MPDALKNSYDQLMTRTRDVIVLNTVGSIVNWDMETKMPPKGINLRSQQLGMLQKLIHRMTVDPEVGNLLSQIEKHKDYDSLNTLQKRNIYLIRKDYDEQTKLPEDLVVETAKQEAISINTWKKAKAAKNFSMFKPELEKMLDLKKKAADILMQVKGSATPYDALIDIYEPKMTSEKITEIFTDLRKGLVNLIAECVNAPKQPDTSFLNRKVPLDTQKKSPLNSPNSSTTTYNHPKPEEESTKQNIHSLQATTTT
jgi:carboxypeptidase Taq